MRFIRIILPVWVGESQCDSCGQSVGLIVANDPPDFELINSAERKYPVLCPKCAEILGVATSFILDEDMERLKNAPH